MKCAAALATFFSVSLGGFVDEGFVDEGFVDEGLVGEAEFMDLETEFETLVHQDDHQEHRRHPFLRRLSTLSRAQSRIVLEKCWKPATWCVPTFQYEGQTYTGCTMVDSNVGWCAHKSVFERDAWSYCFPCDGENVYSQSTDEPCWKPARYCVPEFVYKGRTYKGCTLVDNRASWCGHDQVYKQGSWSYCRSCDTLGCWKKVEPCVSEFYYDNQLYRGCTSKDSTMQWCSHAQVYLDGGWSFCEATQCAEKHQDEGQSVPIGLVIGALVGASVLACVCMCLAWMFCIRESRSALPAKPPKPPKPGSEARYLERDLDAAEKEAEEANPSTTVVGCPAMDTQPGLVGESAESNPRKDKFALLL